MRQPQVREEAWVDGAGEQQLPQRTRHHTADAGGGFGEDRYGGSYLADQG